MEKPSSHFRLLQFDMPHLPVNSSPGPTFKAQDMCLRGERAAWPREVALVETRAKVGRPSPAVQQEAHQVGQDAVVECG